MKLLGIERTDTWLDIDEHTNVHDLEESINIKVQLQKQLIFIYIFIAYLFQG